MTHKPFILYRGVAARLLRDNIDTDQIIPSREMKSVTKTGLAGGLFAGERYLIGREENPDFILNQKGFRDATILISGQNFGCGSSREHAVWALKEYGFRALIAEGFGEIFYNNCILNGIAPIQMKAASIAALGDEVTIDVREQTVDGLSFEIAESDKRMLVEGLDLIALTLLEKPEIDAHFEADRKTRPFLY